MGRATVRRLGSSLGRYETNLAALLTELGVALTGGEDLEALVQSLKKIVIGDRRVECFSGAWAKNAFLNAYGFIPLGGEIGVDRGTLDVQEVNKLSTLRATFTTDRAGVLEVAGADWTVSRTGGQDGETITAEHTVGPKVTRFDVYDALSTLRISSAERVEVYLTLSGVGEDSGSEYRIAALFIQWSESTWVLMEDVYHTWGEIETAGLTWRGMETTPEPK